MLTDYVKLSVRRKKKLGIHIIFIDYVQLLNSRDGFSDNRYLNLNYITRRLKELAKELDVPIVILSQQSCQKTMETIWKRSVLD